MNSKPNSELFHSKWTSVLIISLFSQSQRLETMGLFYFLTYWLSSTSVKHSCQFFILLSVNLSVHSTFPKILWFRSSLPPPQLDVVVFEILTSDPPYCCLFTHFFFIWQFELLFKERINIAYPMPKKIQILDFANFTSQVPVIKGIDLGDFKSVLPALRRRGLGMIAQRSRVPSMVGEQGGCLWGLSS